MSHLRRRKLPHAGPQHHRHDPAMERPHEKEIDPAQGVVELDLRLAAENFVLNV